MGAVATMTDPSLSVRRLNDAFRQSFVGGVVMVTAGVETLGLRERLKLLASIRAFTVFELGHDPHDEHDFGAIDQDGERYFWKIDYYDRDLRYGSPDPADPTMTTRVLTIMRADEY